RCPRWFRALGEALYWGERAWQHEQREQSVFTCRLFKTPVAGRLERWRGQWLLRQAFAALVISACVQLCLLPLSVVYFHRFSFAALWLNLFVGALMVLGSAAALLALPVSALSAQLAAPLVWVAERAHWLMSHSVDPFARAGVASLRLPEYAGWPTVVYALYLAPPMALAYALARWSPFSIARLASTHAAGADATTSAQNEWWPFAFKLAAIAWGVLFFVVFAHPFSAARGDGRLRVDFLDVGQGDAALLTLPDGTTLLVDGGGRPRFGRRGPRDEDEDDRDAEQFERDTRGVGEAVVSEYLWWRGLDRVDYLLATHAHADHIEGLNDVARNFAVRAAFAARASSGGEEDFARLAATLGAAGTPLQLIGRGDTLHFGGVRVDVLWPRRGAGDQLSAPDSPAASRSDNDDSLVLRVGYGGRCFLLTGDIEARAEAALVKLSPEALRCDVLKVAHHGSRTSSTSPFVAAARARLAVVSVGAASPFGHPDAQVVARWRSAGAEVLQTGHTGTITISTDGSDLRVETFTGKR
ncbi:MAG: ComEC/Rec2 family competence protein, partial [Pyrinomonadaceae bacterium]